MSINKEGVFAHIRSYVYGGIGAYFALPISSPVVYYRGLYPYGI
jgi:hypothetical protein